jgi:ring-1,2-phenylacetyl-CoA epoxidase subunit PaaC
LAEIAAKAVKEATYHLDRSAETVIALGDGTPESHEFMQNALNLLWPFTGEMFHSDEVDAEVAAAGIAPDPASLRDSWTHRVRTTLSEATLSLPEDMFAHKGGRTGKQHTEHLGHLLTQMQWLQRAYPDASW